MVALCTLGGSYSDGGWRPVRYRTRASSLPGALWDPPPGRCLLGRHRRDWIAAVPARSRVPCWRFVPPTSRVHADRRAHFAPANDRVASVRYRSGVPAGIAGAPSRYGPRRDAAIVALQSASSGKSDSRKGSTPMARRPMSDVDQRKGGRYPDRGLCRRRLPRPARGRAGRPAICPPGGRSSAHDPRLGTNADPMVGGLVASPGCEVDDPCCRPLAAWSAYRS